MSEIGLEALLPAPATLYVSPSTSTLYVLNAAALTKVHAVEQLAADLTSYGTDIAIITETHLKSKHTDSAMSILGYSLNRRDRQRRRGGGVALYIRSTIPASVWTYSADDRTYELLWMRAGGPFVGALYHPPRPLYTADSLLDYIEACVDELNRQFPTAPIILAGDFNQLSNEDVAERTGLSQIVYQPTRGHSILDRVFVSWPMYRTIRVATSTVRSDHKAVVAYAVQPVLSYKTSSTKVFRSISPAQHAQFLQHISTIVSTDTDTDYRLDDFDEFHDAALSLLNYFYPVPERTITVTSRDPHYITPAIKAKLRRKNHLRRAGRVEEADALAKRLAKK